MSLPALDKAAAEAAAAAAALGLDSGEGAAAGPSSASPVGSQPPSNASGRSQECGAAGAPAPPAPPTRPSLGGGGSSSNDFVDMSADSDKPDYVQLTEKGIIVTPINTTGPPAGPSRLVEVKEERHNGSAGAAGAQEEARAENGPADSALAIAPAPLAPSLRRTQGVSGSFVDLSVDSDPPLHVADSKNKVAATTTTMGAGTSTGPHSQPHCAVKPVVVKEENDATNTRRNALAAALESYMRSLGGDGAGRKTTAAGHRPIASAKRVKIEGGSPATPPGPAAGGVAGACSDAGAGASAGAGADAGAGSEASDDNEWQKACSCVKEDDEPGLRAQLVRMTHLFDRVRPVDGVKVAGYQKTPALVQLQATLEDEKNRHHFNSLVGSYCACPTPECPPGSRLFVSVQTVRLPNGHERQVTYVSCENSQRCRYKVTANAFARFLLATVTISAKKVKGM